MSTHSLPQAADRLSAAVIGGSVSGVLLWLLELATQGADGQGVVPPPYVIIAITNIVTLIVAVLYRRYPGFQAIADGHRQAGKAQPILLAILAAVVVLSLAGCSSMVRKPETTYEALLIANTYGEQVTLTVNDLRRSALIDNETHQEALDHLQRALNASRAGRVAWHAGNATEAESNLRLTEAAMRGVARLIAPHLPETPENEAFVTRYGGITQ